jgi:hypothetical protein
VNLDRGLGVRVGMDDGDDSAHDGEYKGYLRGWACQREVLRDR